MREPSRRIILWALASLLGLLSLGDRGFHALTATAHADQTGRDDAEGLPAVTGEDEACPACRFLGQAQILVAPPTLAGGLPAASVPVRLDPPGVESPAGFVASSRGPPRRA